MGFFDLSDNTSATNTGTSFAMGGGDFEPIPNNTDVLAAPDESKWDSKDGGIYHIAIRWVILSPKEFSGRKIFQKIHVESPEPKKADKAKRMLAAIDANAGGKLVALGRKPMDQDLAVCLINKPMILKLMVFSLDKDDGTGKITGNWIAAVSPRGAVTPGAPATPLGPTPGGGRAAEAFDDDIPF